MLDVLNEAAVSRGGAAANPLDALIRARANWRQAQVTAATVAKFATRVSGGPYMTAALTVFDLYQRLYPGLPPDRLALLLNEVGAQLQGAGRAPRRRVSGRAGGGSIVLGAGWTETTDANITTPPDPGIWEPYTGENFWADTVIVPQFPTYDDDPATWALFSTNPITLPYTPTAAVGVTAFGFIPSVFPTGEWMTSRTFSYSGVGGGTLSRGVGRVVWFGTDAPDPQPMTREFAKVGNIGLPGMAPATRQMTPRQARILHRWRFTMGLAEGLEPARPTRPEAAIDSVVVAPGRVRPGPPHVYAPAPPRSKEIKIRTMVPAMLIKMVANSITETGDFIEQIWKSLPKQYQRAGVTKSFNRRIDSMLRDIWFGAAYIDWQAFQAYYEANQLEDLYYGATGMLATAAGARLRRGAGGFGMGHALGLHGYSGRGYGQGAREHDPVSWQEIDPVSNAIDAYERWALDSRRRYIQRQ